jgi:hypothetical protein
MYILRKMQATYLQRNIEAPSRNNCSRKKQKYYIFWVCVCSLSYPACKSVCAVLYSLFRFYHFFFTFSHKRHNFQKKLLNVQCLFWFTLQRLSEAFLGALVKLRKVTLSLVMSDRLSVRIEQLGSHWTNFQAILYLSIFQKSVEKNQFSLKSDKNNGHLARRRPVHIYDHISLISS